jgi:hypothetical protein
MLSQVYQCAHKTLKASGAKSKPQVTECAWYNFDAPPKGES